MLLFSIFSVQSCVKDIDIPTTKITSEDYGLKAQRFAQQYLTAEELKQFEWKAAEQVEGSDGLIGIQIRSKQTSADKVQLFYFAVQNGTVKSALLHTFVYNRIATGALPVRVNSLNIATGKSADLNIDSLRPKDPVNGGIRANTERKSLVAPGGSLPLITIVGTYSDGSAGGFQPIAPITYFLVAGGLYASTFADGNGNAGLDPSLHAAYLDPLSIPGAGGSIPAIFDLENYDVVNGILYSRDNFPGINDGFTWKWWHGGATVAAENTDVDGIDGWWNGDSTFQDHQTVAQQKPKWQDVYNNYPKNSAGGDMPSRDVCVMIGGEVRKKSDQGSANNACALRVSRALNYSGISIPEIPGKTWKGGDGKNYFFLAAHLYAWLRQTFGAPDVELSSTPGNAIELHRQVVGIHNRGIYIMTPHNSQSFGASGHCSLWGGLNAIGGNNYMGDAGKIYVWRLGQ